MIARPELGGLFLGWRESSTGDTARQTIIELDLAGNVLRQTKPARVNQQLAAMGMHSINSFHHEGWRSSRWRDSAHGPGGTDPTAHSRGQWRRTGVRVETHPEVNFARLSRPQHGEGLVSAPSASFSRPPVIINTLVRGGRSAGEQNRRSAAVCNHAPGRYVPMLTTFSRLGGTFFHVAGKLRVGVGAAEYLHGTPIGRWLRAMCMSLFVSISRFPS